MVKPNSSESKGNGNLNLEYFRPVLESIWDRANPGTIPDPTAISEGLDRVELLLSRFVDSFGSKIFVSYNGDIFINYNDKVLRIIVDEEKNK